MKKINNVFVGTGTALATMFRSNGGIDWSAQDRLVDLQLIGGVDFLVPCGTTGESPTLDHGEHDHVIRRVVEKVGGAVPVLAGTGSNSTKEAVRLTRAAKKFGADGALVVAPYYNKPEQEGFIRHYRKVAEVGLPIVLYDIPGRCGGQGVSAETIIKLAQEGTICGLKWASGNLDQLQKVLDAELKDFAILSGDDNRTVEIMEKGAHGVISVLSNIVPVLVVSMVCDMINGFPKQAREQHNRLLSLMEAMFIETNPIPVKTALAMMHPDVFKAVFRLPLCEMGQANEKKLREVLKKYHLLPASK